MSNQGRDELLEPFLQALESRKALEIPQETVLGAVTHFLSTLPKADLPRFTTAVLESDYLWASDGYAGDRLAQAVALAVTAKVDIWERRHKTHWCASRKVSSACRRWLDTIQEILETSDTRGIAILEFRAGLLSGLASTEQISWGEGRMTLEEAVVLGVSELGLPTAGQRELAIICDAIHHIEAARLRALDLEAILPFIQNALVLSLDQNTRVKSSKLAVALGRLFEVLSDGSKRDKEFQSESVDRFVGTMRRRAEASEGLGGHANMSDKNWNRLKTELFGFLVPSSNIIDILLRKGEAAIKQEDHATANLCIELIATLAAFSSLTQQSEGGLEGHDRVLFGALDILVAIESSNGVKRLFKTLVREEMSDSRASFILRCGELVVNEMDDSTLVQDLLPLSQSYLNQPQAKFAFEAAHAFIAAVITSTSQSDIRPLPQANFAEEIVPCHTRLLVQQLVDGDITTDQFRSAYPPTVNLASKVTDALALDCIEQLDTIEMVPKHKHTVIETKISTAQYIPTSKLRVYLDKLAEDIADTPAGDERLELAANAFSMVVRELGDQQKRIGIDWWLERKGQIEGKAPLPTLPAKAKL